MNLPIYNIKGKGFYFLDRKLNEYRSVKNPFDRIDFNKVDLKNLVKEKMECERNGSNKRLLRWNENLWNET